MLRAFAAVPKFTVLLVHCKHVPVDEFGAREFIPESYSIVSSTMIQMRVPTSTEDFKVRYQQWLDNPASQPFEQESAA